jgi:hypothetical protein
MTPRAAGAPPRPAEICRQLLAALDASEGRRRRRKRDTNPDAIGLAIKRTILEDAVRDDPEPDGFERWLAARCLDAGQGSGGFRAMALDVLAEWRLSQESSAFRSWLLEGSPSDDSL